MIVTLRTVLRDIGSLMLVVGGMTVIVAAIPLIFREWWAIPWILLTAFVYLLVGSFLKRIFRNSPDPKLGEAMVIAALGWLFVALIGAIPFLFMTEYGITRIGGHYYGMDFLSAFFESMSGWTGTGLTMTDIESTLPKTLQFWRSSIQWIGGMGVIVLTLAILARPGTGSFTLYHSEARDEKIRPSIISTLRVMWGIFIIYTLVGIALLWLAGMPLWDAVNHSMTALATGGFSVTDESIASYDHPLIEAMLLPLMIFGAIAFAAHYDLLRGRWKKFFSDVQSQALFLIIGLGIVLLTLENLTCYETWFESLRHSSFQFISALTCTGFQTTNVLEWGTNAKLLIIMAMILGGAAGSTAGGIKLFRGVLFTKGVFWKVRRAFVGNKAYMQYRIGNKTISRHDAQDQVSEAAVVSFLWVILLVVGVFVLRHLVPDSFGLQDVMFEVASAQGNVGLSTGITHIGMNPGAKLMLIFNMWIGRLEIIPILVMIKAIFTKKGKY
ncbi:MAG: potassium transporter Trk [Thermoplasmata archaeon HGW-Thermoplasmata-1]|nr:MAG: potassium transporter Trk [Thermoplasmata archaeon HGW-Thermoplasmata-1]